jgi:hypothetical protein
MLYSKLSMSLIEDNINQLDAGVAFGEAGNKGTSAMDGCTFSMWSAKTGQYAKASVNGMVWGTTPTIFKMQKIGGFGLRMFPVDNPTWFMGVTGTGSVHRGGEKWLKFDSASNEYTGLVAKYMPWGRGMEGKVGGREECAGSITIGHHFSMEHQMKNEGTAGGVLTTQIGDSYFFFKFHSLGPWLDIKYTIKRIGVMPKLQRQCCMKDYIGALGDESCGIAGYLDQNQRCDNLMVNWCDRHPTDRECGCLKSPLGGSSFPVGCDTSCTRGASVYLIGPTARALDAGCTHINCKQIVSMDADQKSRVSDVHIKQHCADLVHSDAKSVSQALADEGKTEKELTKEKAIKDKANESDYVASSGAPTVMSDINSIVASIIPPAITDAIPDVNVPVIDNHKALFVVLLVILVLVMSQEVTPKRSMMGPPMMGPPRRY